MQDELAGAGVGALITGVIGAIGYQVINYVNNKHKNDQEKESSVVKEYREIMDRLGENADHQEKRINQLIEKIDDLQTEHSKCQLQFERALGRIEMLESALEFAKIPFRPWNPDGGSSPHLNLPDRRKSSSDPPDTPRRREGEKDSDK